MTLVKVAMARESLGHSEVALQKSRWTHSLRRDRVENVSTRELNGPQKRRQAILADSAPFFRSIWTRRQAHRLGIRGDEGVHLDVPKTLARRKVAILFLEAAPCDGPYWSRLSTQ